MSIWPDLKTTLADLAARSPSPLRSWPGAETDPFAPVPYQIRLAAWATDVARHLHERYGAAVDLQVGMFRYPDHGPAGPAAQPTPPPLVDGAVLSVALDAPALVRSGHAVTRALLVGNHTAGNLEFGMGPWLLADVVDPATGRTVGGYSGIIDAVRRGFTVAPGGTTPVELLIATDSVDPDLGYAVPPGDWGIQVTLYRIDGTAETPVRTPMLPLTITD